MKTQFFDLQTGLRNQITPPFSDLTREMAFIPIQVPNDELRGDIPRESMTARFFDLLDFCGSSVAAQFSDLTMVNVWQSGALHNLLVVLNISITAPFDDLQMVDAC